MPMPPTWIRIHPAAAGATHAGLVGPMLKTSMSCTLFPLLQYATAPSRPYMQVIMKMARSQAQGNWDGLRMWLIT